jgi:predicted RNA binding protein YcfA (HicA-like mRNA interferase family)
MNLKKLLRKALGGTKNLRFDEAVRLAEGFGFRLSRTSGSHHIFAHGSIPELVNLQDVNGKAKPYQVRQLLRLVERYNLQLEDDE